MEGSKRDVKSIKSCQPLPKTPRTQGLTGSFVGRLEHAGGKEKRLLRNQPCLLADILTEELWTVTCSASGRRGKRELGLIQLQSPRGQ